MDENEASKAAMSSLFISIGDRCTILQSDSNGGIDSKQAFISRMKSFRRWSSKPVDVSPWWCSRYGWYYVEKDLLQCVDCRQYLSAHLPNATDDAILRRKCANRLRTSLMNAHVNTCLWRSNIVSEDICAPNVVDYETASKQFSERLQSLQPYFPVECSGRYFIDDQAFSDKGLTNCIKSLGVSGYLESDVSREACIVALLGWKADSSCKESICCDYCLRRIGLWIFRIDTAPSLSEPALDVDPLKVSPDKASKNAKRLDPIAQHHKWCPWLMAVLNSSALYLDTSAGDDSALQLVPNWLALFRLLSNHGAEAAQPETIMKKAEINEHYALARQLLNETVDLVDSVSSYDNSNIN